MNEDAPSRWIDDEQTQPEEFARAFVAHASWAPDASERAALWNKLAPQLRAHATAPIDAQVGRRLAMWLKYALGGAALLTVVLGSRAILGASHLPPGAAGATNASTPLAMPATGPATSSLQQPIAAVASAARGNTLAGSFVNDQATAGVPDSISASQAPGKSIARFKAKPSSVKLVPSTNASPTLSGAEELVPQRADVQGEIALLVRARRVLAAAPARSLVLVAEHERSYPHGAFAEEREVIAIDALHQLGRDAQAQSRASAFARDYPQSAHRKRVADNLDAR